MQNMPEQGAGFPTPVYDFVRNYAESGTVRMHMPGHKGRGLLGCEALDITEIRGADELYEADGILAESERNAAALFGAARTLYSAEGSSLCIRAMLYLARLFWLQKQTAGTKGQRPVIVAARNVHKVFLYAAALLDFELVWLWPETRDGQAGSVCSCPVSPEQVEAVLSALPKPPAGVYLTSPDYLGGMAEIRAVAEVCHAHDTLLLADNAHGAYLHFLEESMHPLDLGADFCCDSAHKTLPVLTGGAYLHLGRSVSQLAPYAKDATALFGSTSPSYLILASLDLCNRTLAEGYRERLSETLHAVSALRKALLEAGIRTRGEDPLRLSVCARESGFPSGLWIADFLRGSDIECEYADPEHLVLMLTPENTAKELRKVSEALCRAKEVCRGRSAPCAQNAVLFGETGAEHFAEAEESAKKTGGKAPAEECLNRRRPNVRLSVRDAVLSRAIRVPVAEAEGRICALPAVSCPPAIPIVMPGEEIDAEAVRLFVHYGFGEVSVVEERPLRGLRS